eukprot:Nk52_evm18s1671 gene=Nk52_evmTU18s1671
MAEERARNAQYEYKALSNLVLRADRSLMDTRGGRGGGAGGGKEGDASGEVRSLHGRLSGMKMGDRVRSHVLPVVEKLKRERGEERVGEKGGVDGERRRKKRGKGRGREEEEEGLGDVGGLKYRPKTRESKSTYELLLSFVQGVIGDQPRDVLCGAVDEVLEVLKNDRLKDSQRKEKVEEVLGMNSGVGKGMRDERFAQLIGLSKKITDYVFDGGEEGEGGAVGIGGGATINPDEATLDDEFGVAVVFDEDEDEDEEDGDREDGDGDERGFYKEFNDVIDEEEDEDDDEGEDEDEDEDEDEEEGEGGEEDSGVQKKKGKLTHGRDTEMLNPLDIDAYWLQRELRKYYGDAVAAQEKADRVLEVLVEASDDRECENKLVLMLDYDKFEFIRVLRKNRVAVAYCTLLAKAQSDSEKGQIEREMEKSEDPKVSSLLIVLRGRGGKDRAPGVDDLGEGKSRGKATAGKQRGASQVRGRNDMDFQMTSKRVLDLEDLQFHQGGHLMSNKKCQLSEGSFKKQFKGYEEIHIPPSAPKPYEANEKLVKIEEMPDWSRIAFEGFKTLNRVQSRLYPTTLLSDENVLLCAPTGAGKTNVAMCCILREIGKHISPDGSIDLKDFKIVYVAPMKSLVQEMVGNFSNRLKRYGIKVGELTGDSQMTKDQISETQIIVCTPEKWDIITRKSGDRSFTNIVKLVIIDEIHLLHDERGPVLEAIVARALRRMESTEELVRLVGLSATLPNYKDVALFLRVDPNKGLFYFDNSFRPCPLRQVFVGINEKKALKRFQLMNEVVYKKIEERAGKSQILVFVHSRKETVKTAKAILDMFLENGTISQLLPETSASYEVLRQEAENIKNAPDLKDLLPYGFACHHAGMSRVNRTNVEELFADNHIQVLVSTATLAWGVNLPAHTVIIKGTQIYSPEKGRWTELGALDVLQMLGRAGRPQYDTEGEGILITSHTELQYYLSLLNQQLPVESQMISKLADNLNAEVVSGTVRTVKEAVQWLSYTFLFIRMLREPTLYGISVDEAEADPELEQRRVDLAYAACTLLDKSNLIRFDRRSGKMISTDIGRIASHFYVTGETMGTYNSLLKPTLSDIDLFRVFSLSAEFKFINVRQEEKLELQKLLERVPIPVKEGVDEPSAKVNVLMQAYISQLKFEGLALFTDMVYVTQSAGRLMRALFEIVLSRGWARLGDKILSICKMVDKRMWLSMSPLRQFKKMPIEVVKKLEKKDFPWERYFDLTASELGELVRVPKFGKVLFNFVHQLPKLDIVAHVQPITRSSIRVEVSITPDFVWDKSIHGVSEAFWVFVEDGDNERILHREYFLLKARYAKAEHNLSFFVPLFEPLPPQYFVRVVSDRWIASETIMPVSFRHLLLPDKNPPPTDLLDLHPLPVNGGSSSSAFGQFVAFYKHKFSHFNAIQSQVFNSLFTTNENVFVGAAAGSGKTVCAEFAICRMLVTKTDNSKCVYVVPKESQAKQRLREWTSTFTDMLGVAVTMLVGETTKDLRELERGQIVITTPQNWDIISRRWRKRKNVQNIDLFIADDVHMIGANEGPLYEMVCSRMRFMAFHLERKIRIVALGYPVANYADMGNWLGMEKEYMFNFSPSARPVPLEVRVEGYSMTHAGTRLAAMSKPVYASIANTNGKKSLVFVPARKDVPLTAFDLMTYAAASSGGDEDAATRFLLCSKVDIEPTLAKVSNATLRETLSFGIGLYHEGLSEEDCMIVESLFNAGAIQVIVSTRASCWTLNVRSQLVILMDTQYFDGKEHQYLDYPIVDVVQMLGFAVYYSSASSGGMDIDGDDGDSDSDPCKAIVMCQSSRTDFFRKYLNMPLPVESHLNHFLHDHLNGEIVTGTLEDKQNAVDYLSWVFLFRRLTKNPNYYGLTGTTHRHLSEFLSELIEDTLVELEKIKCISITGEDEDQLEPLNLGMIAAYYSISYRTIEIFSESLTPKTKMKGFIQILSEAAEFEQLPVRHHEDEILRQLARTVKYNVEEQEVEEGEDLYAMPQTKANLLLQAHFGRLPLTAELQSDLENIVLKNAGRLTHACVDVVSSNGWLGPALVAMEFSQMVTQAMWGKESLLKQIPYFTPALIKSCEAAGVESIFDLMDLEDKDRMKLLGDGKTKKGPLTKGQLQEVARYCNRYPNIDVEHSVVDADNVQTGEDVAVKVNMTREDEDEYPGPVIAPFFPVPKDEGWWLVIGDRKTKKLISIKRVPLHSVSSKVTMKFECPGFEDESITEADVVYTLYFMSDSYLGCDQEYEVELHVTKGEDESSSSEGEDSSDD